MDRRSRQEHTRYPSAEGLTPSPVQPYYANQVRADAAVRTKDSSKDLEPATQAPAAAEDRSTSSNPQPDRGRRRESARSLRPTAVRKLAPHREPRPAGAENSSGPVTWPFGAPPPPSHSCHPPSSWPDSTYEDAAASAAYSRVRACRVTCVDDLVRKDNQPTHPPAPAPVPSSYPHQPEQREESCRDDPQPSTATRHSGDNHHLTTAQARR
jgi:hypothetical protein